MVSEHRRRGFSEEKLAGTFSLCSSWNGIMAILAGFIAQISCDIGGDIGPFSKVAIALTVKALILLSFWRENYGEQDIRKRVSIFTSIKAAASSCFKQHLNPLSWTQSGSIRGWRLHFRLPLGEGSWDFLPDGKVPTGLVMTCFMLAMTIGGSTSAILQSMFPDGARDISALVYAISALAMAVPAFFFSFGPIFVAMLILEAMVGVFNAYGATLRSKYYPEAQQSAIMCVFGFH